MTIRIEAGCLLLAILATQFAPPIARATDQFQFYFGSGIADAGLLGGAAFDADGDFWLIGFGPEQRIRHVESNGGGWSGIDSVIAEELNLFHRSADLAGGQANSGGGWGPQFGGSANALLLNPTPLTINVPIGSGGTQSVVYPAGSLAFIADSVRPLTDPDGVLRYDATKKLYRYDLRTVLEPTTAQPDYNTAQDFTGGPVTGVFGIAEWNDVFQPVVSELDLRNQSGGTGGDSFGRQFAWSTDGQSIYAVDSSIAHGGIYRIDPTRFANDPTGIQRIWVDDQANSATDETRMRTEPGVLHTSAYDYLPSSAAVGDQILVEGSFLGGNSGGVNVFVDEGCASLSGPSPLFTEQQFREFADYQASGRPFYLSILADTNGDLYISEQNTRLLFRYDTQGRFSKIFSERELDLFQESQANASNNDVVTNLSLRESNAAGFATPEIVYVDAELNTPIGVLAFQPGDFDRDNDLDAADLSAFAAVLTTRNSVVDDADTRFDMNGNEAAFRDVNNEGEPIIRHESNGQVVVDWRDVKVLQQFADFPNGDANFDGALDFTDIGIVEANYYTLGGAADKVWIDGDFASADPDYIFDAPDANLVNQVDLAVLADAWVNALGQPAVTAADADNQGYTGQFRTDLLAAFAALEGLAGDYNGDNVVDAADYAVWRNSLNDTGAGLPADGNNDMVVNQTDYNIWREHFGASMSHGAPAGPAPEPHSLVLMLMMASAIRSLRTARRTNHATD